MSTRSNIAIRLREEDRNKTFETPWGETVKPNGKQFLYVYCHNDGYPEGVGADLKDMFNGGKYEDALEYILMGDRSTTDLTYWDWRREECAPYAEDNEEKMYQNDYLYIIEEVNGVLKVRQYNEYEEEVDEDQLSQFVADWFEENGSDYDEDTLSEMLDDCCEAVERTFGIDPEEWLGVIDGVLRQAWEEANE